MRTAPSPTIEAAPLWGLAAGAAAGCVTGALAVFSGGPLGTGRLAAIGPSGWQVALVAALEIGIAAAVTAGIANWLLIPAQAGPRRPSGARRGSTPRSPPGTGFDVNPWADDENREPPPDAATPWPVPLDPQA